MSARTYICVTCRWSRRAEAAYGLITRLRCPTCNGKLWELEWRWRIPRKTDDDGWKELAEKVARDAAVIIPELQRTGATMLAKLDEQVATAEKQRDSLRKTSSLKKLHCDRMEIIDRYALPKPRLISEAGDCEGAGEGLEGRGGGSRMIG